MTRDEVDGVLRDRAAEWETISASLVGLDSSAARKALERTPLTGMTRERWAEALAASARLWVYFEAYRAVLDRARAVRERRSRPGAAELDELTALLSGPAVAVTAGEVPLHDRSLTGPVTATERLTLTAALVRMSAAYGVVSGVVGGADAVWSAVMPRLEDAAATLSAARDLAADLNVGSTADPDLPVGTSGPHLPAGTSRADLPADPDVPAEPDLARLDRELAEIRHDVASDPLSMWDVATGAVRAEPLDELARDIESARAALAAATRLRDGFADRVAGFASAVERLAAAEAEAHRAIAMAGAKVRVPPVPAVPVAAPRLRRRLDSLTVGRGDWRGRLAAALRLERDLAAAQDDAAAGLAAATALLQRRGELRGRLDAYRAKAGRLGHAEDAALHRHYLRAHDLLWTAPSDLTEAEAAIVQYRQALDSRVATRGATG